MRTLWTVTAIGAIALILGVGMYRMMPHRAGTQTGQDGLPASTTPTIEPLARSVSNLQYVVAKHDGSVVTFSGADSDGTLTDIVRVSDDLTGIVHGVLSPDSQTLYITDPGGNVLAYNISVGTHSLLKASDLNPDGNFLKFIGITLSPSGKTLGLQVGYWEASGFALMETDGSGYHEIPKTISGNALAFSPDSKRFTVTTTNNDFGGDSASLYVASVHDPDNGTQLLPTQTDAHGQSYRKDAFTPAWSPDGTKIAFGYKYLDTALTSEPTTSPNPDQFRGIYVVNADGTSFHEVTSNQSYSSNPVWANDSQTLFYGLSNVYSGDTHGIFSIDASGKSNASVFSVDAKGYLPVALSPDGTQLSYRFGELKDDGTEQLNLGILNLHTKQSVDLGQGVDFVGWVHRP